MRVHPEKRFLEQVFRIRRASYHSADVIEQGHLVPFDQRLERGYPALPNERHQLLIARLMRTLVAIL
jgi:hypothetical protein